MFSLGLYKVIVSVINGYTNIGFTIALMIIAPLVLGGICRNIRITPNGRKYLKNLELAFKDLKKQSKQLIADDPKFLLLMGLFGVSSLAGTPYDNYRQVFVSNNSGGDSGGSSCSSSSCGGGGCGGGGCGG